MRTSNQQHPFSEERAPINKFAIGLLILSLLLLGISYFLHWNIQKLLKIENSIKIENPLALVLPFNNSKSALVIKNESFIPFKVLSAKLNILDAKGTRIMEIQIDQPQAIPRFSTVKIPLSNVRIQGLSLISSNLKTLAIRGNIRFSIGGFKLTYPINKKICFAEIVKKP